MDADGEDNALSQYFWILGGFSAICIPVLLYIFFTREKEFLGRRAVVANAAEKEKIRKDSTSSSATIESGIWTTSTAYIHDLDKTLKDFDLSFEVGDSILAKINMELKQGSQSIRVFVGDSFTVMQKGIDFIKIVPRELSWQRGQRIKQKMIEISQEEFINFDVERLAIDEVFEFLSLCRWRIGWRVYGRVFMHILDYMSDILTIVAYWSKGLKQEAAYKIAVVGIYIIFSTIFVYSRNGLSSSLLQILDLYVLTESYQGHKLFQETYASRWIRLHQAMLEAYPSLLIDLWVILTASKGLKAIVFLNMVLSLDGVSRGLSSQDDVVLGDYTIFFGLTKWIYTTTDVLFRILCLISSFIILNKLKLIPIMAPFILVDLTLSFRHFKKQAKNATFLKAIIYAFRSMVMCPIFTASKEHVKDAQILLQRKSTNMLSLASLSLILLAFHEKTAGGYAKTNLGNIAITWCMTTYVITGGGCRFIYDIEDFESNMQVDSLMSFFDPLMIGDFIYVKGEKNALKDPDDVKYSLQHYFSVNEHGECLDKDPNNTILSRMQSGDPLSVGNTAGQLKFRAVEMIGDNFVTERHYFLGLESDLKELNDDEVISLFLEQEPGEQKVWKVKMFTEKMLKFRSGDIWKKIDRIHQFSTRMDDFNDEDLVEFNGVWYCEGAGWVSIFAGSGYWDDSEHIRILKHETYWQIKGTQLIMGRYSLQMEWIVDQNISLESSESVSPKYKDTMAWVPAKRYYCFQEKHLKFYDSPYAEEQVLVEQVIDESVNTILKVYKVHVVENDGAYGKCEKGWVFLDASKISMKIPCTSRLFMERIHVHKMFEMLRPYADMILFQIYVLMIEISNHWLIYSIFISATLIVASRKQQAEPYSIIFTLPIILACSVLSFRLSKYLQARFEPNLFDRGRDQTISQAKIEQLIVEYHRSPYEKTGDRGGLTYLEKILINGHIEQLSDNGNVDILKMLVRAEVFDYERKLKILDTKYSQRLREGVAYDMVQFYLEMLSNQESDRILKWLRRENRVNMSIETNFSGREGVMIADVLDQGQSETLPLLHPLLVESRGYEEEFHWTQTFFFAATDQFHLLANLLEVSSEAVNESDFRNWSPLHVAAINGHHLCIRILLNAKADPCQEVNHSGRDCSPYHLALESKYFYQASRILFEATRFNFDAMNQEGWSVFDEIDVDWIFCDIRSKEPLPEEWVIHCKQEHDDKGILSLCIDGEELKLYTSGEHLYLGTCVILGIMKLEEGTPDNSQDIEIFYYQNMLSVWVNGVMGHHTRFNDETSGIILTALCSNVRYCEYENYLLPVRSRKVC